SKGRLWAGGHQVIGTYDHSVGTLKPYPLPDRSSGVHIVRRILEDRQGKIWAVTRSGSLLFFDEKNDRFEVSDLISMQNVNDALIDGNYLWLTTSNSGLARLNIDSEDVDVFFVDIADGIRNKSIITRDNRGLIWLITGDREIYRVAVDNRGSVQFHANGRVPGNSTDSIKRVIPDEENRLWMACREDGLFLFNTVSRSFQRFEQQTDHPYSLSENSITAVYKDQQHRIWIGTAFSGIHLADPMAQRFEHHHVSSRRNHALSHNVVTGFQDGPDNGFWIATYGGGMNYMNRSTGEFTSYSQTSGGAQSLNSHRLTMLKTDESNELWIGSDQGINLLRNQRNVRFSNFQQAFGIHEVTPGLIYDVHFDQEHSWVWIPLYGRGLLIYKIGLSETTYIEPVDYEESTIPSSRIYQVIEDRRNNVWLATDVGPAMILSGDKRDILVHHYKKEDRENGYAAGNEIRHMAEDASGDIWFATDHGLMRYSYSSNSFESFFKEDGLPSNDLRFVLNDNRGYLWIGTSGGLSRMDVSSLTFRNFSYLDGTQGNEYNRGAAHMLEDGTLLFGGTNGFDILNPDDAEPNPNPPLVYITGISVTEEVDAQPKQLAGLLKNSNERIGLGSGKKALKIDFTAINYTLAHQNQLEYTLERFDSGWIDAGTRRYAEYRNLPPGRYTFRVRAANHDGVWSPEEATLSIRIRPPLWRSVWFYLVVLIAVIALVKQPFIAWTTVLDPLKKYIPLSVGHPKSRKSTSIPSHTARGEKVEVMETMLPDTEVHARKQNIHSILDREVKNPCRSIIGFSEYLREKFIDEEDTENRDMMNSILYAAHHTYSVLNNLILWANNEAEQDSESISLNELLNETLDSVRFQAETKNIEIRTKLEYSLSIENKKVLLHSILETLVSYVIKNASRESNMYITLKDMGKDVLFLLSDEEVDADTFDKKSLKTPSDLSDKIGSPEFESDAFDLQVSQELLRRINGRTAHFGNSGNMFAFSVPKSF
ncbi:two-component regulator propeller domain-containing protein, partial [Balneolaceae bacterium ANBcel3]|nr:two-component regulator propeller domain-containing protein [Balneolaceae bacterium ANBcel3]